MKIFRRMRSHDDLLWRSSQDLSFGKIFAKFLRKSFWRFLEEKILIKTFSFKNLQKIYINFHQKIFKQFLRKIFLRSLKSLQLKSFKDFLKICSSNLLEIFERSSSDIFLRSTEDLLAFFIILFTIGCRYKFDIVEFVNLTIPLLFF